MILPLEEGPVSQTSEFKQIRDCFYDTDSPLSVTEMALFYSNWPDFINFPLVELPVSQTIEFKQCFDS